MYRHSIYTFVKTLKTNENIYQPILFFFSFSVELTQKWFISLHYASVYVLYRDGNYLTCGQDTRTHTHTIHAPIPTKRLFCTFPVFALYPRYIIVNVTLKSFRSTQTYGIRKILVINICNAFATDYNIMAHYEAPSLCPHSWACAPVLYQLAFNINFENVLEIVYERSALLIHKRYIHTKILYWIRNRVRLHKWQRRIRNHTHTRKFWRPTWVLSFFTGMWCIKVIITILFYFENLTSKISSWKIVCLWKFSLPS